MEPQPIVGLRAWRAKIPQGELWSLFRPVLWTPGAIMRATCHHGHHAPQEGCACGFSAFLTPAEPLTLARVQEALLGPLGALEPPRAVFGLMQGWGVVLYDQEGFRAQFARMAGLVPGPGVERLAQRYGVPLLDIKRMPLA